jgi:hypothetical protein
MLNGASCEKTSNKTTLVYQQCCEIHSDTAKETGKVEVRNLKSLIASCRRDIAKAKKPYSSDENSKKPESSESEVQTPGSSAK